MTVAIPQYNFDWSRGRVRAVDIPRDIVDRKIALYEKALAENDHWMISYLTNEDNTIFTYAFLKWNNKPIKLFYYQDAIINDKHLRINNESANQIGKSFTLQCRACCDFLKEHGQNWTVIIVSRSKEQNMNNMQAIKKMLSDAAVDFKSLSDSMSVTERQTGEGYYNRIVCTIAGDSSLGFSPNLLMLDEFEFWKEDSDKSLEYYYDQVYDPRTQQTNGQIIIISNPNGKNFVSDKLHKRTLSNGLPEFHVYNVRYIDMPGASKERWDTAMKYKHPIIFASTMAAQRTEAEGSALTENDIQSTYDAQLEKLGYSYFMGKPNTVGIDLGYIHDQSVIALGHFAKPDGDDKAHLYVALKHYPQMYEHNKFWGTAKGDEISVKDFLLKYSTNGYATHIGLDITGKEGNEQFPIELGFSVEPIKMTGQFKATWYERFIALVKQGRVHVYCPENIIDGTNKDFMQQCRTLQISTKMPDGRTRPYPRYRHTKESDHDDLLDAVVLLLSMVDEDMAPSASSLFIERKPIKSNKISEQEQRIEDQKEVNKLNRMNRFNMFYGGV